MQRAEVAAIQCLGPLNASPNPLHFAALQSNTPAFDFSRVLAGYPSNYEYQIRSNLFEWSSNSTSDEADEQQMSVVDERKRRRMISNRESARRSRMRKQRYLDELWSQVLRLRSENRELIDRLNDVFERHERVVQENGKLREEASRLRRAPEDLQLEEVPCNTAHLRAESSSQSIATTSMDLLH